MSNDLDQTLTQAHEFIEVNRHEDARALIAPLLAQYPNDVDVLWVYAHAVEDPQIAEKTLAQLVRIAPHYEGAEALLNTARQQVQLKRMPLEARLDLDELEDEMASERAGKPARESSSRSRLAMLAVGAVVVIALFSLGFVLFGGGGDDEVSSTTEAPTDAPTPVSVTIQAVVASPTSDAGMVISATSTAVIPTALPTATPVVISSATPLPVTSDAPAVDLTFLGDTLAASGLTTASESIELATTQLGQTAFAAVCSGFGAALRETTTTALVALAQDAQRISSAGAVDAVGVRLTDCATSQVINSIVVSLQDAQAFAAGSITQDEFRRQWQAAN